MVFGLLELTLHFELEDARRSGCRQRVCLLEVVGLQRSGVVGNNAGREHGTGAAAGAELRLEVTCDVGHVSGIDPELVLSLTLALDLVEQSVLLCFSVSENLVIAFEQVSVVVCSVAQLDVPLPTVAGLLMQLVIGGSTLLHRLPQTQHVVLLLFEFVVEVTYLLRQIVPLLQTHFVFLCCFFIDNRFQHCVFTL